MVVLTLRDLFAGNVKNNLMIIEIYVHKKLDPVTFIVGDSTRTGQLSIKKNPILRNKIKPGASVRCVRPRLESNLILLTHNTIVFQSKTIQAQQITDEKDEINDASFTSFADLDQFGAGSNVPSLVAKIVSMPYPKKAKYVSKTRIRIADIKGQQNWITIFGPLTGAVQLYGTYQFIDLTISKYQGSNDRYKRLHTNPNTRVEETNNETSNKFANFFDGEDIDEGTILGNDDPIFYTSCCHCGEKWDDSWDEDICGECGKSLNGQSKTNDFYVMITMLIPDEGNRYSQMHKFRISRQILGLNTAIMNQEEIKKYLVSLAHEQCRIYFNYPTEEEDPAIMNATYFLLLEKVESPTQPRVRKRKISPNVE